MVQVRFEFLRGSDGASRAGWCDTAGAWNFSATNTQRHECQKAPPSGSGHALCLSGTGTCDGSSWNSGWTNSATLGDAQWDYAYQAAPNHLGPGGDHVGARTDHMVAGYGQAAHDNNAAGGDYQMRIWLREP